MFGEKASKSPQLLRLEEQLRHAQIPVRGEAYLATAWYIAMIATIVVGVLSLITMVGLYFYTLIPVLYILMGLVAPGFAFYFAILAVLGEPGAKAKKRKKDIDAKLPYAINYITAMAGAGVIPTEIFKSLATQQVYGEVAREAAFIYKDMEVHGKDVVTAMRRAIERCPSDKFRDLMTGAITTVTSGGDLTHYFQQKAERLQFENRQEQQSFIETMGIMAESYVTAAVAGPLFLLVMVAIFVLMGSGEMIMLQLIIYLLLPIANLGFMFGLKALIPEV